MIKKTKGISNCVLIHKYNLKDVLKAYLLKKYAINRKKNDQKQKTIMQNVYTDTKIIDKVQTLIHSIFILCVH